MILSCTSALGQRSLVFWHYFGQIPAYLGHGPLFVDHFGSLFYSTGPPGPQRIQWTGSPPRGTWVKLVEFECGKTRDGGNIIPSV